MSTRNCGANCANAVDNDADGSVNDGCPPIPGADIVPLVRVPEGNHYLIKRVLDERSTHRAPASRFRDELEDYMSEASADTTLRAIISWARYGEAFAYEQDSGVFSLENPG